jgi:hypothetical protein
VTAKELTAEIKQLRCNDDHNLWECNLGNGTVVHVRCEPQRYLGVFYRVWTTRRTRIAAMLFAITPETAGRKARSLVTKYGGRAS